MKQTLLRIFLLLAIVGLPVIGKAEDTNATPDQAEANYTEAIEGRTADILKALQLLDKAKENRVHDTIMAQYRALRAWHDDNDVKLKAAKADTNAAAQIKVSLKAIHDAFLSRLGMDLSSEQVDQVKDKMTYGKVQFTMKGYLVQYPSLTDEQKGKILEILKQAREEAMDGGSSEEKTAIFTKAKGKINNYLSKQGIHPEKRKPTGDTNTPAQ
jgi:hypothetical protein